MPCSMKILVFHRAPGILLVVVLLKFLGLNLKDSPALFLQRCGSKSGLVSQPA